MNLTEELERIYEERRGRLTPDEAEIMARAAKKLFDDGKAELATNVGDEAPRFSLPNATHERVTLSRLLRDGPVILSFYRGSWCPYCNLELRALQANLGAFEARGARLVAISPQVPDESLSLAEKHGLTFDVLSDVGATVAHDYGLSFDIPEELAAIYENRGYNLIRAHGGHDRTLVIPATYVVGQDGRVSWAFVDSDHAKRADPLEILTALDVLP